MSPRAVSGHWQQRDLGNRRVLYVWADKYGHKELLAMSAEKKWRKLDGQNRLPDIIIQGIEFRDEMRQRRVIA